jgi:hypothetical protein
MMIDNIDHVPVGIYYALDRNLSMRNSQDIHPSCSRGKQLLELCIASQLRILNGRTLGDSLGKFTYHGPLGSSVIDYAIVSERLLDSVLYFPVHDLIRTVSDHCIMKMRLGRTLNSIGSYRISTGSYSDFFRFVS